jgi:hypothetical protein
LFPSGGKFKKTDSKPLKDDGKSPRLDGKRLKHGGKSSKSDGKMLKHDGKSSKHDGKSQNLGRKQILILSHLILITPYHFWRDTG